jgi:7-keto-8-aminopelargonate synthetase-like enzyme
MGTPAGVRNWLCQKILVRRADFQQFAIPQSLKGSARLRITVTASYEKDQIRSLCEAIKRNSLSA